MKDFKVFAEVHFYCCLGIVQAETQDEAIIKAEAHYKKAKDEIDLWGDGSGVDVYEFTADQTEKIEGVDYLEVGSDPGPEGHPDD